MFIIGYYLLKGSTGGLVAVRFDDGITLRRIFLAFGIGLGELYELATQNGYSHDGLIGWFMVLGYIMAPATFARLAVLFHTKVLPLTFPILTFCNRTRESPLDSSHRDYRFHRRLNLAGKVLVLASAVAIVSNKIEAQRRMPPYEIVRTLAQVLWLLGLIAAGFYAFTLMVNVFWRINKSRQAGIPTFRFTKRMVDHVFLSNNFTTINVAFATCLSSAGTGLIRFFYFHENAWAILSFVSLSVGIWLFVRLTAAPALTFLATSSPQTLYLHYLLTEQMRPLRVLALLDAHRAGSFFSVYDTRVFFDCLRTEGSEYWRYVVYDIAESSLFVVIDGRVETGGVLHEAEYLLGRRLGAKAIFVTHEDGFCPVYERVKHAGKFQPHSFVAERELLRHIEKLFAVNANGRPTELA